MQNKNEIRPIIIPAHIRYLAEEKPEIPRIDPKNHNLVIEGTLSDTSANDSSGKKIKKKKIMILKSFINYFAT